MADASTPATPGIGFPLGKWSITWNVRWTVFNYWQIELCAKAKWYVAGLRKREPCGCRGTCRPFVFHFS
eukprot:6182651-Pleurochrysis_carterae.AAC.2